MAEEMSNDLESFIRTLPDPEGARVFLERLGSNHLSGAIDYSRKPKTMARLLTAAAYSPFLAETVLRHPEHIAWLEREAGRIFDRVKSKEQLSEDLARFVAGMVDSDHRTQLVRFKRREMLRIYLRDCLGLATLAEVTEELSNLADVILDHALALSHQAAVNLNGVPLTRDGRGRTQQAEFSIVALGKLGCRELNYASDIDLLFLYRGEGETAGDGCNPQSVISNREFFAAVAGRLTQMVGGSAIEGSVYRIDLRLRPYGRDGDLVWEVERAADYYQSKAHNWERQALIRARASAGSESVVARFLDRVRDVIFARDALPEAVADVRRAKEKIDRQTAQRGGGFNVKLGRGGIREIEFIIQALQLRHGGREPWLRSAQTLIVLARLAEKSLLTETERARLSAAYTFLRTAEHRLQMEHGAQIHRLPIARARLRLLARRCGYIHSGDPASDFLSDLEAHTSAVRAIYDRVFAQSGGPQIILAEPQRASHQKGDREIDDETTRLVKHAAAAVSRIIEAQNIPPAAEAVERAIISSLATAISPLRSLRNLAAWADSFATYARERAHAAALSIPDDLWPALIERLISTLGSHYLSSLLVSRPLLAFALLEGRDLPDAGDVLQFMRSRVSEETALTAKADALRRAWHRCVIDIGYRDLSVASCQFSVLSSGNQQPATENWQPATDQLRANNLEQTRLAEAALRTAAEVALDALAAGVEGQRALPFTILGLGRLGHMGMDYGSDLDLLVVFDDGAGAPHARAAHQSPQEFYAKLTSQIVHLLSSITREGLLYRVDLRLRPDGASGPLAHGLSSLVGYLKTRASAWEHSAYLKAREVAGDLEFGARARHALTETVFDAAARNADLKESLHEIRMRLEKEKGRGARPNIKWGRGGMTDAYFVTRYLQLRHRVSFPTERGTSALILHLGEIGLLNDTSARALYEAYMFLRRLDHWMRLLLDRPTPVLPASHVALGEIARALSLRSIEELESAVEHHTTAMRDVYDGVFE